MSTTDSKHSTTNREPWELYALVGAIIAQTALIVLGNVPYVSPWFLALLALGIEQALLLPSAMAWFAGLGIVVIWVIFRQAVGVWTQAEIVQSLAEIIGVSINMFLAIAYKSIWNRHQQELHRLRSMQHVLVTDEALAGLLTFEVGQLRLQEEVDRACQFRRPIGLLLVEIEFRKDLAAPNIDERVVYHAVARRLVRGSTVHDISGVRFVPWQGFNAIAPAIVALLANDAQRQGPHNTFMGIGVSVLFVFGVMKLAVTGYNWAATAMVM